jgi:hypothetical protein
MVRRKSRAEYEAFVRAITKTIRPGTISGHRADGLAVAEEQHFCVCPQSGQGVDKRDLGAVFYHEVPGHKPLPEN